MLSLSKIDEVSTDYNACNEMNFHARPPHIDQVQGNWAGRNFVTKSRVNSRLITHAKMYTEMNLKSTTTNGST